MASLGQSSPSPRTRDSDRPDPCDEKRELRRMVKELEAENERLQKKCNRQRKLIDKIAALTGGSYRPEMAWEEACEEAFCAIEDHWMSEESFAEGGEKS